MSGSSARTPLFRGLRSRHLSEFRRPVLGTASVALASALSVVGLLVVSWDETRVPKAALSFASFAVVALFRTPSSSSSRRRWPMDRHSRRASPSTPTRRHRREGGGLPHLAEGNPLEVEDRRGYLRRMAQYPRSQFRTRLPPMRRIALPSVCPRPQVPRISVSRVALVRMPIGFGLMHWAIEMNTSVGTRYFEASKSSKRVQVSHRLDLSGGARPEIVAATTHPDRIRRIIARMQGLHGRRYDLLGGNCEKIAKIGFFGSGRSEQASIGSGFAAGIGLLALGASGPIAVIGGALAAFLTG